MPISITRAKSELTIEELTINSAIKSSLLHLDAKIKFFDYSRKGANGYVFFGVNRLLNRKVAVKFYYWGGDRTSHAEPQNLATIKSPYVIEIIDADTIDNDWAFFETPLYDDGDLDELLRRGTIPHIEALDKEWNVLVGLNALHSHSLLHRDLKPENIFLKSGFAIIGDFGSVKGIPHGVSHVTGSGHSLLYRPPETFIVNSYGVTGDIYQCGILLYQLLGGYLPDDEISWLTPKQRKTYKSITSYCDRSRFVDEILVRRIKRGNILDLDSLPDWTEAKLKRIVRKATRIDPAGRYRSTTAMLAEIENVRKSLPDWRMVGDTLWLHMADREIRIVRGSGTDYIAEMDKGRGWRVISDSTRPNLRQAIEMIQHKYCS